MANSVYIGMSSAIAQQQRLEVVSNNIANSNTVGFRQQRAVFNQYLVDTLDGSPAQKGGTRIGESVLDTQAGAMEQTGNPLDLAIEGDGYFAVRGPAGVMLTRAGNFQVAGDGKIVDSAGLEVLGGSPESGFTPILARPDGGRLSVGSDGSVEQDGTALAQISVVTVDGPLRPTGGTHLQADPATLRSVATPTLAAGYLEGSNVNPVRGMIELIEISKDFQSAQKLMSEIRKLDRSVMGMTR